MPFHLSEKISLCATIVRVCVRDEEPSFPGSTVEVRRSVEDYSLQSGGNRTNKGATSVNGKVSHQIGWNWQCISSSRDPFHPFFSSRPSRVEIVAGHTRGEVDSGALTSGLPEYHEEISHKETEKHPSYSHHSGVIWRLTGGKKKTATSNCYLSLEVNDIKRGLIFHIILAILRTEPSGRWAAKKKPT